MDWFEYKNEIPLNTLKTWREEILSTAQFTQEGWSGAPKEPFRHWCSYQAVSGLYLNIFNCLNESFKEEGLNLKPERAIINIYNHGDSSWLHTDTLSGDNWTAILFMNEYWDINWHGHFVMVKDNEIYKAVAPTPGKFILFKNSILHGPSPVSREAQFPRIGLAIQCTNNLRI
jgi:hypothetical protein